MFSVKCLGGACLGLAMTAGMGILGAFYAYEIIDSGELVLDNAPGVVSIVRESDSAIIHIKGDNWESIAYG